MKILKRVSLAFFVVFLMPLMGAATWWSQLDHPANWRAADWGPTGLLPAASDSNDAQIYVLAARTGGFKGAFSVHSWIVFKEAGATRYERYDKVGWGEPIRHNAYAPDANWYSNPPSIITEIRGKDAQKLIPHIRQAIAVYPYAQRGDYTMWPGPNSNTFIAHILREVPEIGAVLPPHAVGKDYLGDQIVHLDTSDINVSLWGYAGFSGGMKSGFEIHLLGQSFGFDISDPALKLPGIGRVGS